MDIKYKGKIFLSKLIYGKRKSLLDDVSYLIAAAEINNKAFGPYKNFCNGQKDLVICAAGPSLQNYKPIEDAVHIAVNRSFLYDKVDFDFIFAQDLAGISMCMDQLRGYRRDKCVKFLGQGSNPQKKIPESYILSCNARKFCLTGLLSYGKGKFEDTMVCDIDRQPISGMMNVGQSVMQLALFMNPRRLYIVGCDISGNHFTKADLSEAENSKSGKVMDKVWKKTDNIRIAQ